MSDPSLPVIAHHVQHIQHVKPIIMQGFTLMTVLISSLVSFIAGGGLGWYVKSRGMAGVKIDLANVKTDVENLKAKISAPTPTV